MSDVREQTFYDEQEDRLVTKTTQDVDPYLAHAKEHRDACPETGAYMNKKFVYAATIPENIVNLMRLGQCCSDGKKYNLLSPDPDEYRRALLHVQSEHKHLLTIRGKPFAKHRVKWE